MIFSLGPAQAAAVRRRPRPTASMSARALAAAALCCCYCCCCCCCCLATPVAAVAAASAVSAAPVVARPATMALAAVANPPTLAATLARAAASAAAAATAAAPALVVVAALALALQQVGTVGVEAAPQSTATTVAADAHGDHAGHGHAGHDHAAEEGEHSETDLAALAAAESLAEACAFEEVSGYSISFHIGAIFALIAVSLGGCLLPMWIGNTWAERPMLRRFLTMGSLFGAGTVLATGFIHMFLPAQEALTSPCLSETWHEEYTAFSAVFVIIAIFAMQTLQYALSGSSGGTTHSHNLDEMLDPNHADAHMAHGDFRMPPAMPDFDFGLTAPCTMSMAQKPTPVTSGSGATVAPATGAPEMSALPALDATPAGGLPADPTDRFSLPRSQHSNDRETLVPNSQQLALQQARFAAWQADLSAWGAQKEAARMEATKAAQRVARHERRVTTTILEVGIAAHSVIIGISLGVAAGAEARTLLAALCFHQFFEGLALGTALLIAEYKSRTKMLLMALGYALATPLGQAIGMGIHSSYNGNAPTALLVQGIFDALSAGILIYTALVSLIQPMLVNNPKMHTYSRAVQVGHWLSLYAGAAAMAIIGRWA